MKSTWFGDSRRYEFSRLLREADYSRRHDELFSIFLTCAVCTFEQAGNCFQGRGRNDVVEQEHVRAVAQVKHPEKLVEALCCLVDALEERAYDFLGCVLQELSLNDKSYRGQCFTPAEVSECMAQMALVGLERPQGRRLSISEPACGCGAMVIAVAKYLKQQEYGPGDFYVHAVDVDHRCAEATYLQCSLLDIPAIVEHGNTLTLETFKQRPTLALLRTEATRPRNAFSQAAEAIEELIAERHEGASLGPALEKPMASSQLQFSFE